MPIQHHSDGASTFLSMCASGQVREAFEQYVSLDFVHHNAYFPNDRDSLLSAMEKSAVQDPNKSFTIMQIIENDGRVALLSRLTRRDSEAEYAVVHILRFDGDFIVEMWDIGQAIPPISPNELGMF